MFTCICFLALAINCYICDSSVNPKCVNLTDRAIKPEVCIDVNEFYAESNNKVRRANVKIVSNLTDCIRNVVCLNFVKTKLL